MESKQVVFTAICLLLLNVTGCGMIDRIVADQTATIFLKAASAYDRESDLELAEQAGLSNLKMLEGLLEANPDNADLLILASRSFLLYASGFIEEKIEIADERYDFEEKSRLTKRAVDFYERAKTYGLRALVQDQNELTEVTGQKLDDLSADLGHLRKKHVAALFWTAYSWGSIINLQQREPSSLVELPRVDLMMQRVLELDESFFFGGAHLFYGIYYGSRPEMLGGAPLEAKKHLERAIEISNGKYLMAEFLLARYYYLPAQNREMFEHILQRIANSSPDLFPEQRLANELARRRAKRWLRRAGELFF